MVLEDPQFEITPGLEEAFEAGVKQAVPLFQRAKGCISLELGRSVEKPTRYRLFVQWEMLENHTVNFRESANFRSDASSSATASRPRPRWSMSCECKGSDDGRDGRGERFLSCKQH